MGLWGYVVGMPLMAIGIWVAIFPQQYGRYVRWRYDRQRGFKLPWLVFSDDVAYRVLGAGIFLVGLFFGWYASQPW